MLNKVMLIGRVGKDPEIRSFQNGGRVANFSLATSDKWKDKTTGENKEKTEWHNIQVFGGLVSVIENYCSKGTMLYLEGALQTRSYETNSGEKKYITEVVLNGFGNKLNILSSKDDNKVNNKEVKQEKSNYEENDFDDDIPF